MSRVLLLPLDNETAFPHISEELRNALATEMQTLGRFEVVPAPVELFTELSHAVRENGRFNELLLIRLARMTAADVVVVGTVSQYSPYPPIRIGLVLQAISPEDGLVVASVDGIWDTDHVDIAGRARDFYRQDCKRRDEPVSVELALTSPRLYQRFVCAEATHILVTAPAAPVSAGNGHGQGGAAGAGGAACGKCVRPNPAGVSPTPLPAVPAPSGTHPPPPGDEPAPPQLPPPTAGPGAPAAPEVRLP